MRIVGGTAGGLRLTVPRSPMRPTMDRVKAAIFSSLADAMAGARVLDLFAGSGALGIEALSRGAAAAVFVEQDPRAIAAIRQNLAASRQIGEVIQADCFQFLRNHAGLPFDLVFADPPYLKDAAEADLATRLLDDQNFAPVLATTGIFVLEQSTGEPAPNSPHFEPIRQKSYGASRVSFFRKSGLP